MREEVREENEKLEEELDRLEKQISNDAKIERIKLEAKNENLRKCACKNICLR